MKHPSTTVPSPAILRVGKIELEVKNNLLVVCAWCNRVRDINNSWQSCETDELIKKGYKCTHTVCNDCKTECLKQLPPPYAATSGLTFGLA